MIEFIICFLILGFEFMLGMLFYIPTYLKEILEKRAIRYYVKMNGYI